MNRQRFLFPIVVIVLATLLVGCATLQSTSSGGDPPSASPAPTQGTVAQPTVAGTTPGTSSSGNLLTCVLVQGKSSAQYKVREQLARLDFPSDAVGVTQDVSGTIAFMPDGSIDQSVSKFVVGLASLKTDQNMRDNYVRRNILQTDQYPQAVFAPTEAPGFPLPIPQSGTVNFKLAGNLTIRDVTKPVTLDVTGTVQNDTFTGTATTSFTFEDFNLPQPRVPVVLSVVDKIDLELNMTMQRAQN